MSQRRPLSPSDIAKTITNSQQEGLDQSMDAHGLFEILVRENADMLTAYIHAVVRDPSAVDDLFQEAMLTAWKRLNDYDKSRPFGPWLRGIAAKLMLAYHRRTVQSNVLCDEQTLEQISARFMELHRQPGDTFEEKLQSLRECIGALPDQYREVIRLRYDEEVTGQQLADQLGMTVETLKKRMQRGRAWLLNCLKRKLALVEG